MDAFQTLFNIVFAAAGVLGGWVMKFFYDKLHDLTAQDSILADKVQRIEVLVAGEYVKASAFNQMRSEVLEMLHRIESKLDGKVDK